VFVFLLCDCFTAESVVVGNCGPLNVVACRLIFIATMNFYCDVTSVVNTVGIYFGIISDTFLFSVGKVAIDISTYSTIPLLVTFDQTSKKYTQQ